MSASLLNQQSLKPLPILLASLLASIFLLSSVSLDVSGGYTRPSSIWFPNPLSPAPFDLPLNRLTGLIGNGTTFNIAVMVLCASYSPGITPPAVNTTLLQSADPMDQMTAFAQIRAMQLSPEQVESGSCQTGIGLYSGELTPHETQTKRDRVQHRAKQDRSSVDLLRSILECVLL